MSNMYPRVLRKRVKRINDGTKDYFTNVKNLYKKTVDSRVKKLRNLAEELSTEENKVVLKSISDVEAEAVVNRKFNRRNFRWRAKELMREIKAEVAKNAEEQEIEREME